MFIYHWINASLYDGDLVLEWMPPGIKDHHGFWAMEKNSFLLDCYLFTTIGGRYSRIPSMGYTVAVVIEWSTASGGER
jgi:hypothetical protein